MATETMLPQEDFESLQKEIQDELLTPEEHKALLAEFFQAQGKGGFKSVTHEREDFPPSRLSQDACLTIWGRAVSATLILMIIRDHLHAHSHP